MTQRLPTTELLDDFHVGDDLQVEVTILSPEDPYPAIDLTGCTVTFGLRRIYLAAEDSPDQVTKTLQLTDPTNGKAFLWLTSSNTEDLTPGEYYYGFVLTDASSLRTTIVESRLNILPSTTPAEAS